MLNGRRVGASLSDFAHARRMASTIGASVSASPTLWTLSLARAIRIFLRGGTGEGGGGVRTVTNVSCSNGM